MDGKNKEKKSKSTLVLIVSITHRCQMSVVSVDSLFKNF